VATSRPTDPRRGRPLAGLLLAGALCGTPAAWAADPFVVQLDERLGRESADQVNTRLAGDPGGLALLHRDTTRCDLQAVAVTVQLSRASGVKSTEAHREALRIAVGSCTGFVLALLSMHEVPRICRWRAS
jgi:hypothetical protein